MQVPVRLGVTVSSFDKTIMASMCNSPTYRGRYDLLSAQMALIGDRDMLFGVESHPKYTGQAVWRATWNRPLEVNPVSDQQMYVYLVQNLPNLSAAYPQSRPVAIVPTMMAALITSAGRFAFGAWGIN